MAWFASIVTPLAALGIATGSIMLILGHRFIEEFTRPTPTEITQIVEQVEIG